MLDFKHFVIADYRPGEPDIIKYRAQKRRRIGEAVSEKTTVHVPQRFKRGEDSIYDAIHKAHGSPAMHNIGVEFNNTGKREVHVDGKKHSKLTIALNKHLDGLKEETDVDEALTVPQRLQRKRQMVKYKAKISLGRERAKRRMASKDKLEKRATRQARMAIFKKLTKDIPKGDLTYQRRAEIEKRLEKPAIKQRIKMIARKLFPQVRKNEVERKRRASSND